MSERDSNDGGRSGNAIKSVARPNTDDHARTIVGNEGSENTTELVVGAVRNVSKRRISDANSTTNRGQEEPVPVSWDIFSQAQRLLEAQTDLGETRKLERYLEVLLIRTRHHLDRLRDEEVAAGLRYGGDDAARCECGSTFDPEWRYG
eukprot:CAMPEP_0194321930 /NCGR_PEP_ID=MMETSP0171-20130528/18144_1 /TAXON_ID=218684 /ORGANISM="Corethron pennatum, Strain L29A3" /LENGTH=147 /DNA_ID=CAMNT_0039080031 /DNA_START=136 /DNA_END=576 /DNA_ORIENTATION=+